MRALFAWLRSVEWKSKPRSGAEVGQQLQQLDCFITADHQHLDEAMALLKRELNRVLSKKDSVLPVLVQETLAKKLSESPPLAIRLAETRVGRRYFNKAWSAGVGESAYSIFCRELSYTDTKSMRCAHTHALLQYTRESILAASFADILRILQHESMRQKKFTEFYTNAKKIVVMRLLRKPGYRFRKVVTADQLVDLLILCKDDEALFATVLNGVMLRRWYYGRFFNPGQLAATLEVKHIYQMLEAGISQSHVEKLLQSNTRLLHEFKASFEQSLQNQYSDDAMHHEQLCLQTALAPVAQREQTLLAKLGLNEYNRIHYEIVANLIDKWSVVVLDWDKRQIQQIPTPDWPHDKRFLYFFALCVTHLYNVKVSGKSADITISDNLLDVVGDVLLTAKEADNDAAGNAVQPAGLAVLLIDINPFPLRDRNLALYALVKPLLNDGHENLLRQYYIGEQNRRALASKQIEVVGTIAEGAFGRVLKLRHTHTKEVVGVLKTLKYANGLSGDPTEFKNISSAEQYHRDEMAIYRQLHSQSLLIEGSKNVLHFINEVPFVGVNALWLEYVAGITLADYLIRCSDDTSLIPDDPMRLSYICGMISGIHYLHQRRIFHGDLKPLNIMLREEDNCIKIMDFGSAIYYKEDRVNQNIKTMDGFYTSPEMMAETDVLNLCWAAASASDIYVFAIMAWQIWMSGPDSMNIGCSRQQHLENLTKGIASLDASRIDHANLSRLISRCWIWRYEERPSAEACREAICESKYK